MPEPSRLANSTAEESSVNEEPSWGDLAHRAHPNHIYVGLNEYTNTEAGPLTGPYVQCVCGWAGQPDESNRTIDKESGCYSFRFVCRQCDSIYIADSIPPDSPWLVPTPAVQIALSDKALALLRERKPS